MSPVDNDTLDGCLSSTPDSPMADTPSDSKIISRLKKAKTKVASKTKDSIARVTSQALDEERDEDTIVTDTLDDSAFHPVSSEDDIEHEKEHDPLEKVKSAAKSTARAILHPKKTIQAKVKGTAAGEISAVHKSHTQEADISALLDAHNDVENLDLISSTASPNTKTLAPERERAKDRVQHLENELESKRIAWVTQHIDRVKVVSTHGRRYPLRKDYYIKHDDENSSFDFPLWIGHFALWYTQGFTAKYIDDFDSIPFDLRTFRSHLERLAVVSVPWQVWAMDVRSIYQWQKPWRTARWLVLWIVFWYFDYVASFFWASIIYYTVRNKINPRSVERLRASLARSEDSKTGAFAFAELMDRHGDHDWLDPMIDQLGPYVQLQLFDLVNLFEALANFYSWSTPYTMVTLFFLVSCLAVSVFTDIRYALRLFWFLVGGAFFFCWPIASLYPQYRILVSPFRWIIWDIPTDAESAIDYLSKQCQNSWNVMLERKADQEEDVTRANDTTDEDSDSDSSSDEPFHSTTSSPTSIPLSPHLSRKALLSYRSLYNSKPGQLHITPTQVFFSKSLSRRKKGSSLWHIPYDCLSEMRKYKRIQGSSVEKYSRSKHEGNDRVLELESRDGNVYTLDLRDKRDEAFNYILGFSGVLVQWQNLQC